MKKLILFAVICGVCINLLCACSGNPPRYFTEQLEIFIDGIIGTFSITIDGKRIQPYEVDGQFWMPFTAYMNPPPIEPAERFGDTGFSIASDPHGLGGTYRIIFRFDDFGISLSYQTPRPLDICEMHIRIDIKGEEAKIRVDYSESFTDSFDDILGEFIEGTHVFEETVFPEWGNSYDAAFGRLMTWEESQELRAYAEAYLEEMEES